MFPINVPNVLTVLRILAVPVIVVALLEETPDGDVLAAAVFALAAFTDSLDGYIARRREAVTSFGKLMDPLADKLLIAAALIALVSLDRLAAWIAMVIIAREFAVTGLRLVAAEQGVIGIGAYLTLLAAALWTVFFGMRSIAPGVGAQFHSLAEGDRVELAPARIGIAARDWGSDSPSCAASRTERFEASKLM